MAQGLRLELRQGQQLVMTPQLQQAIRLLQMSNIELAAFVEREVEANPLLEIEGEAATERAERRPELETAPGDDPGRAAEVFDTGTENLFETDAPETPRGQMRDWSPAPRDARPVGAGGQADFGDDGFDAGQIPAEVALDDHLLAQIRQMRAPALSRQIAEYLVRLLDADGYLRTPLDEVAERLGVAPAEIEAGLALVQACEPTGVGARSLAECLALQLAERDRLDPAMRAMIDNLELVARAEHRRLRQLCGVDAVDYDEMLSELRALNPRPCAAFAGERAETLVPDVLLDRRADGSWQIELNPETLPRVLIDRRYAARLSAGGAETESWLADRRAQAGWLIRSLDQRARTILRIATEIVRQQESFFERGIAGLKPLTLRTVAEATGLHESTASRVTSNKYIATERGIFELKFFFTNAVGGAAGGEEGVAAEAVRHRIRAMVNGESPDDILSDDTIVARLRAEGIDIARRTVAKYRKNLKIPSSVERRRLKSVPS